MQGAGQVIFQAILVEPLFIFIGVFIVETDGQATAENCFGAQNMAQPADRKLDRIKIGRVRPETQNSACIALAAAVDHLQVRGFIAIGKDNLVNIAAALNDHIQLGGEGVDHRYPNTVEATGELVVVIGKLTAGMKGGENNFNTGKALLRVDIHRHAATIVTDG